MSALKTSNLRIRVSFGVKYMLVHISFYEVHAATYPWGRDSCTHLIIVVVVVVVIKINK